MTMKRTLQQLNEVDERMRIYVWDAEFILRDAYSTVYSVFPSEPHDQAIAAAIGATIVPQVKNAVLVWVNNTEET